MQEVYRQQLIIRIRLQKDEVNPKDCDVLFKCVAGNHLHHLKTNVFSPLLIVSKHDTLVISSSVPFLSGIDTVLVCSRDKNVGA